jgi:uncharacterized protein
MSQLNQTFNSTYQSVASQSLSEQRTFLVKTYSHLLFAVGIFCASLYFAVTNIAIQRAVLSIFSLPFAGFILLAALIGISFLTTFLVNTQSKPMQYLGLIIYPVVEAIIFVPMILVFVGRGAVASLINASWLTAVVFGLLTAVVFITKPNLGFLSKFLVFASFASIILIVLSLIFGFTLGTWFSVGMIMLAAGYILFETSKILETNTRESYVGAALSLFASIAMLFFYILRLFSSRD